MMNEGIVHLFGGGRIAAFAGASIVLVLMGVMARAILTSRRLEGSSLFNRLFVVVAVTSGFFSAVSSAIGFSLITSQETDDFFRNSVLPPAFGVFVFCLAVAIWVGGAELVRHRDWFRSVGAGPVGDALAFVERGFKLFIVIPILAAILFLVSTWTTVVGIGGVDAVRHTCRPNAPASPPTASEISCSSRICACRSRTCAGRRRRNSPAAARPARRDAASSRTISAASPTGMRASRRASRR